jgi:hypothetical protein
MQTLLSLLGACALERRQKMIKNRISSLLTYGLFKSGGVSMFVLYVLLALPDCGVVSAHGKTFDILPWTDGIVYYKFDDGTFGPVAVHADDQTKIENQMARWEQALTITDPSSGETRKYIDFRPCGNNCPQNYLVIRYNRLNADGTEEECNNMSDPVGMELRDPDGHPEGRSDDGITELHFRRGTCPDEATANRPALPIPASKRTNQDDNTILHELGHVLGLWHEFNRTDADAYLVEQPDDLDYEAFADAFKTRSPKLMPLLGNYDYDSVMAYSGQHDLLDNPFSRQSAQAKTDDPANNNPLGGYLVDYSISPGVKSRLLQYYAYEYNENWGFFFRSLSYQTQRDPDELRYPYLADGIEAVGTPAIAYQSPRNYALFARGSDNRIYRQFYWTWTNDLPVADLWRSIGRNFSSDPSAVSRGPDRYDVVAVNDSGEVLRIKYIEGEWYDPSTIRGGYPTGGIKQDEDGNYIGPAIASRGFDLLDVFVVRSDGRLAVSTWSNNNWGQWRTLGAGYDVTARPAAVALSDSQVQLAINETDFNLYEPLVTFGQNVSFNLGDPKGATAPQAPPALTRRDTADNPYRVLITNADGRISHRFAHGSWRDIGGMPKPGTGPSAVAVGRFGAYIVMNGADLVGCDATCDDCDDPRAVNVNGTFIEPGGLWIRDFD